MNHKRRIAGIFTGLGLASAVLFKGILPAIAASNEAKAAIEAELDEVVTELFNSEADILPMLNQSQIIQKNGNEYTIYPKDFKTSTNERCVSFTANHNGNAIVANAASTRYGSDNYTFRQCFDRKPL